MRRFPLRLMAMFCVGLAFDTAVIGRVPVAVDAEDPCTEHGHLDQFSSDDDILQKADHSKRICKTVMREDRRDDQQDDDQEWGKFGPLTNHPGNVTEQFDEY